MTLVHDLRWLNESTMLEILEIKRTTFLGWAEKGIFPRDRGGTYSLPQFHEICLATALRPTFSVEQLSVRWPRLRQNGDVDRFVAQAATLKQGGQYDLVVDPKRGIIRVACTVAELVTAVRRPNTHNQVVVIDMALRLTEATEAFEAWSTGGRRPAERRVGRPASRAKLRSIEAS
jgi:hypothetical protein